MAHHLDRRPGWQQNVERAANGIATAAQAVAIAKGVYQAGRMATTFGRAVIPFFLQKNAHSIGRRSKPDSACKESCETGVS